METPAMVLDGPVLHRAGLGPHADFDVVVRSRVSLNRNLKDTPFPWRLDTERLAALGVRIAGALEVSGFRVTNIGSLDGDLRSALADRELYPRPYLMDETRIA
ncbi:MAG: hypothetical protein RBT68_03660, partial [Spirochaetia bacterium]|nr:hypothetical protein [Spirochaetia bacterium]